MTCFILLHPDQKDSPTGDRAPSAGVDHYSAAGGFTWFSSPVSAFLGKPLIPYTIPHRRTTAGREGGVRILRYCSHAPREKGYNQLPRLKAVVWLERAKRYNGNSAKHWTPYASRMAMTPPAKRQPGVLRPRLLSCPRPLPAVVSLCESGRGSTIFLPGQVIEPKCIWEKGDRRSPLKIIFASVTIRSFSHPESEREGPAIIF